MTRVAGARRQGIDQRIPGWVVLALLDQRTDDRQLAVRGLMDHVHFERRMLAVDRVLGRSVEMILDELVVLVIEVLALRERRSLPGLCGRYR